jgi:hypothetical protein
MEICKCGAKMKPCQQDKAKGSECTVCGRRIWDTEEDMNRAYGLLPITGVE